MIGTSHSFILKNNFIKNYLYLDFGPTLYLYKKSQTNSALLDNFLMHLAFDSAISLSLSLSENNADKLINNMIFSHLHL